MSLLPRVRWCISKATQVEERQFTGAALQVQERTFRFSAGDINTVGWQKRVGCATGRRKVVSASLRPTLVGSEDNAGKGTFFMAVLRRTHKFAEDYGSGRFWKAIRKNGRLMATMYVILWLLSAETVIRAAVSIAHDQWNLILWVHQIRDQVENKWSQTLFDTYFYVWEWTQKSWACILTKFELLPALQPFLFSSKCMLVHCSR